ncbi:DNA excision repair protein ERCC-1 isoform X2 [Leptopilina heterotoma]|uniref:DNA excision repair protein ERCC-1 isoform X2 n=1 Tax=Leptopilina heterotoma TaxID=63436 RepID=UPI001CA9EDCC|nr:DNA excision repair protein ERCC-1 isoform X2 [Leptopilina heterotoma]
MEDNIEIDLTDFEESSPPKISKKSSVKNDKTSEIVKIDLTADIPNTKEPKIPQNDIAEEILGEKSEFTCSFKSAFSKLKQSEFFSTDLPQSSQSTQNEITTGVPKNKGSSSLDNLLINPKQRGNPLMKFITNTPWEYSEIVPDYAIGRSTCILFLSIRYHQLNPDYIHDRLKQLGKAYNLRVLLVQVDVAEPHHSLKHLTRICILADLTLMLAWNAEDAGRIIETYKIYEKKPPDMIMEKNETGVQQRF